MILVEKFTTAHDIWFHCFPVNSVNVSAPHGQFADCQTKWKSTYARSKELERGKEKAKRESGARQTALDRFRQWLPLPPNAH